MGARMTHGPREKPAAGGPSRLWKAATAAFAVTWLAALMRWWPMTRYTAWGSDSGEYAGLIETFLATGGRLPEAYSGWGGGYPDFGGMYIFAGTFASMTGIDSFLVLSVVVPAAAALSALFAFVVALRLSRSIFAAAVAGGIVATAMPEVFAGSHGMPGALGGMMAAAMLAAVVLSVRTPALRWAVAVIALALVPTHHLSAFLAASMLAAAALLEARFAPADLERSRAVDAALLGAGSLLLLSGLFWSGGAPQFRAVVLDPTSPWIGRLLPGASILGVVGLVVLAWYFETRPRDLARFRQILEDRLIWRRLTYAAAATAAAVALLSVAGVPGTSAVVPVALVLPFAPLGFTLAAVAAGPGRLIPVRGSLILLGAALGVAVSGLVGLVFLPAVLIPYRHLQYFVVAAAPIAAVALAFAARSVSSSALPARRTLSRAFAAVLVSSLLAACAVTAFPSKQALVGFEEGTLDDEAAAALWLSWNIPTTLVASDHRLSSVVFGFSRQDATWEAAAPILVGGPAVALPALDSVRSPSGAAGVTVVLLSDDVIAGAALSQWAPATPIQGEAFSKFFGPPFVRAFDNGDAVAYWVVRLPV